MKSSLKDKVILFFIVVVVLTGCFTCATRKRVGCDCWDGMHSNVTGQGACSWHEGVRNWTYEYWWDW